MSASGFIWIEGHIAEVYVQIGESGENNQDPCLLSSLTTYDEVLAKRLIPVSSFTIVVFYVCDFDYLPSGYEMFAYNLHMAERGGFVCRKN